MPKIVTIKDIAREAGVSPSLVSFVFNGKNRVGEETRRRILEVAERLPPPCRRSPTAPTAGATPCSLHRPRRTP